MLVIGKRYDILLMAFNTFAPRFLKPADPKGI
jgi:hypothetical protein